MRQNIFFKIDLLICSIWALFVLRFWVANLLTAFCMDEATSFPEWTLPFVVYIVLMRLSLSFMMLRKAKRGLVMSVVYMLAGGVCWFLLPGEVMTYALRDLYNYLTVATDYAFSPRWLTSQFSPFLFYRLVGMLFPIWLLLMPSVYFLIWRKECVLSGVGSQWVWSGLYLWKDALRNKYLMGCAFFLVSWCIGIVMNEWLSLIAMMTIPAFAFYHIKKGWGCRIRIYELLLVMMASCLLWFAQYETGNIREGILCGSALLMLVPIGFVCREKGCLDGIWYFVGIGILLPSFCLGYDVYTVKEAKRIGNFRDEMCFTGVLIVEDDGGHIALRDRYRLITPLFYTDVKADRLPVVKVEYEGQWKTFNTGRLGYPKGDLNLLEKRLRKVRHFSIIENEISKKKTFEDCVSLARKGNVEAYMELAKRYEEGIDVGQSYANALICFMMGNRLKGVAGDPLEMRFYANHPFRLSIELLEGRYHGEEAENKMDVLRGTAPQDAKAVEAMSIITNRSEKKKALSMLDHAIRQGSEIAVVCMTSHLEDSKSTQKYEQYLIAYVERFPFFYNKLGALYEKRAKEEVNNDAMKLAIEYYKKADRHAMLDTKGASFLLNVYRKEMENGKATYSSRELYRLKLLSEQK